MLSVRAHLSHECGSSDRLADQTFHDNPGIQAVSLGAHDWYAISKFAWEGLRIDTPAITQATYFVDQQMAWY